MKIPLVKPQFNHQKLAQDFAKISQSGILTKGPYLEKFQKNLKKFLGVRYCLATTSCTTALHLGLVALGIKAGDEVLVSDFSFPASANVIVQIGAKPVLVDIDLDTLCINIDDLKKKISLHKKSKAIMVVHAFGYPAKMAEIMKIAKKNRLAVIEDAACALGSKHQGKFCGTWGDLGCFSFHPRKNITTGEGGAIVTDNPKLAKKIEILRSHGGIEKKYNQWDFVEIGFNYRLSELQAALGIQQLAQLKPIIKKRRAIARKLLQKLKLPNIIRPREPADGFFNFQSFVILLSQNINRDDLITFMAQKNIETTLGTYAIHAQKAYRRFGYHPGDLPNSYYAYQHSLTLPLYGQMTDKEIEYVVNNLKNQISTASVRHANAK